MEYCMDCLTAEAALLAQLGLRAVQLLLLQHWLLLGDPSVSKGGWGKLKEQIWREHQTGGSMSPWQGREVL